MSVCVHAHVFAWLGVWGFSGGLLLCLRALLITSVHMYSASCRHLAHGHGAHANDPQAVCRQNVRPHLEGKPFFHYTVKRFVNNAENTKIPLASTKKTKRNISKDTTPCRRHVTGAVIMIETHTSDFLRLLDQW